MVRTGKTLELKQNPSPVRDVISNKKVAGNLKRYPTASLACTHRERHTQAHAGTHVHAHTRAYMQQWLLHSDPQIVLLDNKSYSNRNIFFLTGRHRKEPAHTTPTIASAQSETEDGNIPQSVCDVQSGTLCSTTSSLETTQRREVQKEAKPILLQKLDRKISGWWDKRRC